MSRYELLASFVVSLKTYGAVEFDLFDRSIVSVNLGGQFLMFEPRMILDEGRYRLEIEGAVGKMGKWDGDAGEWRWIESNAGDADSEEVE